MSTIDLLHIPSPKRGKKIQTGWSGFFPYYAGFPESFAREIISNASLKAGAVIHDPWNGSGTTTYSASLWSTQSQT
jgi:DNA modification methylase